MSVGMIVFSIIVVVLFFNIGLYFYAQRHKPGGQVELMQKAVRSMRAPFAKDDADMEELSRRVRALQGEDDDE